MQVAPSNNIVGRIEDSSDSWITRWWRDRLPVMLVCETIIMGLFSTLVMWIGSLCEVIAFFRIATWEKENFKYYTAPKPSSSQNILESESTSSSITNSSKFVI